MKNHSLNNNPENASPRIARESLVKLLSRLFHLTLGFLKDVWLTEIITENIRLQSDTSFTPECLVDLHFFLQSREGLTKLNIMCTHSDN